MLNPALAPEAALFEEATTALARAADRILRKHGKKIIGEQLATRRLADIMIDLFALAAVLARVSTKIDDHGEASAVTDREILKAFARQAKRRVDAAFAGIDDNEDPTVLGVAKHVLEVGRYAWDSV
jgi:hypothetical protein